MTVAQLRRVFTAVLLCMPAHAIINSFIADTATCIPILQRVCLFLREASLAAPCAASTAGGCNISGSSEGHGSRDHQYGFDALYTNYGISEKEVQKMYKGKKEKEIKKLKKEVIRWCKNQEKKKKA